MYIVKINMDIVLEALNLAKNNKSPGLDGITNELLKNEGTAYTRVFWQCFRNLSNLRKLQMIGIRA